MASLVERLLAGARGQDRTQGTLGGGGAGISNGIYQSFTVLWPNFLLPRMKHYGNGGTVELIVLVVMVQMGL